jgi:hypothetical protein
MTWRKAFMYFIKVEWEWATQFWTLLQSSRPSPIRRCLKCNAIIEQPVRGQRGQPRKYCSTRCRAKGIPSAAKRTEYVREYRRRKAKKDILQMQQILLQVSNPLDLTSRLEKEFPKKSRRQLNYMIKAARTRQGDEYGVA